MLIPNLMLTLWKYAKSMKETKPDRERAVELVTDVKSLNATKYN